MPRRRSTSPPRSATVTSSAPISNPGQLDTVHDLSDGGLIVALAEMVMASDAADDIGAQIDLPQGVTPQAFLFGEDQARYLVAAPQAVAERLLADAKAAGVPALRLGVAGGRHLRVGDIVSLMCRRCARPMRGFSPP